MKSWPIGNSGWRVNILSGATTFLQINVSRGNSVKNSQYEKTLPVLKYFSSPVWEIAEVIGHL